MAAWKRSIGERPPSYGTDTKRCVAVDALVAILSKVCAWLEPNCGAQHASSSRVDSPCATMEASIADVFSFVKDGVNGFVEAAGFGENVIGAVAAQGAAFVKKVPAFTEAAQLATDASATTRLVPPATPRNETCTHPHARAAVPRPFPPRALPSRLPSHAPPQHHRRRRRRLRTDLLERERPGGALAARPRHLRERPRLCGPVVFHLCVLAAFPHRGGGADPCTVVCACVLPAASPAPPNPPPLRQRMACAAV